MTAPTPAARDTWRDQLAEALFAAKQAYDGDFYVVAWENNYARDEWYALADAVLAAPVLVAAQREAAAKAVERAADWLAGTGQDGSLPGGCAPDETTDGLSWIQDVGDRDSALDWCQMSLRDRASALRAGGEG